MKLQLKANCTEFVDHLSALVLVIVSTDKCSHKSAFLAVFGGPKTDSVLL